MLPNRCHDNGLITAFGVFTPYFSGSFVRGQPLLSFFGAKLLSSLIFLCVLSSPVFVSVLLLKSFLKSTFLIFSFYDHDVFRSDTKDAFPIQYLVGCGYKSRINTGFSLSTPYLTGVSQGCQSTIPIRKKSLQKQKRDPAL